MGLIFKNGTNVFKNNTNIFISTSTPGGGSSFPSTNLIAYYKFDSDVTDSFGSNDGTNIGAFSYNAGIINDGITYTGASTSYTTFSPLGITGVQPWTVSCWVKVSGTGVYSICGFGAESSNQAPFMYMNNGRIWFDYYGSGALLQAATVGVNSNTWRHVAWKYDGTHMHIYVDGLPDATPLARTPNVGNTYFWVAKVYSSGPVMNGSIDELAVFNASLSDADILTIYNAGMGLTYP